MSKATKTVMVTLMGHQFPIRCEAEEANDLERSAQYLDRQMQEMARTMSHLTYERLITLTALHITHELLNAQNQKKQNVTHASNRLHELAQRINSVLEEDR